MYWWATTEDAPSFWSPGVGSTWIRPGLPPVAIQRALPTLLQTIWLTSFCMLMPGTVLQGRIVRDVFGSGDGVQIIHHSKVKAYPARPEARRWSSHCC